MVWMIFSVEPDLVGQLDDLVAALGVHDHLDVGDLAAGRLDGLDREAAVHRAVPAPQDHRGVAQLLGGQAAHRAVRVPDDAVLERAAEVAGVGVAAEVLVGQEEHLAALARPVQRPGQRGLRVRRGADRAAVAAGEGLDGRGGVHVGDRHGDVGDAGLDQLVPALLDLVDRGHVGHRAPGREVGQHHGLGVGGEDVGRLGHEVHAAEDDPLGIRPGGGLLGQLEGVTRDVGELDDLVALVVVAEHEDPVAQRRLGRAGARDEVGVGGRGQVAGTLDAALAGEVAPVAEHEERQRARAGPVVVVTPSIVCRHCPAVRMPAQPIVFCPSIDSRRMSACPACWAISATRCDEDPPGGPRRARAGTTGPAAAAGSPRGRAARGRGHRCGPPPGGRRRPAPRASRRAAAGSRRPESGDRVVAGHGRRPALDEVAPLGLHERDVLDEPTERQLADRRSAGSACSSLRPSTVWRKR